MGFLSEVVYQSIFVVAENLTKLSTDHLAVVAHQFTKSLEFGFQFRGFVRVDLISCSSIFLVLKCF